MRVPYNMKKEIKKAKYWRLRKGCAQGVNTSYE